MTSSDDYDFEQDARQDLERGDAIKNWYRSRVEVINDRVTAHEVLRRFGVQLRTSDNEEQFSCPFHGKDVKPSARVYPSSSRGPSHVWCFVCQERWDVLKLWRKFSGLDDDKFSRIVFEVERAFGITPPESPSQAKSARVDHERKEVDNLLEICERRLRSARRAFKLRNYLEAGRIIDLIIFGLESGRMPTRDAKEVLVKLLAKIGERERACPDG